MVDDEKSALLPNPKDLEAELAEARRALSERDRTIQILAERLETLESDRSGDAGAGSISEVRALPPLPIPNVSVAPSTARSSDSGGSPSAGKIPPPLPRPSPAGVVPLAGAVPSIPVIEAVAGAPAVSPERPSAAASDVEGEAGIQWHSVTVGRRASLPPDSVPPSQRRDPRRAIEIEIEFKEDTQFFAGLTQDISEGGVFIATYRIQAIGTPLTLAFALPDGTRVTARGEVRWVRDTTLVEGRPGMGVAFTELPPEALAAIARFCRQNAPLYVEF
jgi:uncharacterized protein (TIGR02266 family)